MDLVQQRWFGYNPHAQPGQEFGKSPSKVKPKAKKNPKQKATNSRSKIQAEHAIQLDSDDDITETPPRKKARHAAKVDDDTEEEDSIKIQIYLNVKTPPPPAICVASRSIRQPAVKVTPHGPFIFDSQSNYSSFLTMIANAACAGHPDCLVRSGMEWRFDRPANSTRKPIMNEIGFQVMITSLLERKKDWTITVSMPPPTKHTNDVVCIATLPK